MHSYNLYALGAYKRFDGDTVDLLTLAIHSETNEIYCVLCRDSGKNENDTDTDIYYVEPLAMFGNPDESGQGARHTFEYAWQIDEKFHCGLGYLETGIYEHFKSKPDDKKQYEVFGVVQNEREVLVIYRSLYGTRPMMIRPLSMFLEEVNKPDIGYKGPRFYLVSEN